jgi:hypothetical protein
MPVAPAESLPSQVEVERRVATRHPVRLHVSIVDARARTLADARIADVSVCGARLEDLPLDEDDGADWSEQTRLVPDVVVWLAVHTLPRLIRARIIWRRDSSAGVFFQDVPAPADTRLRDLIPGE